MGVISRAVLFVITLMGFRSVAYLGLCVASVAFSQEIRHLELQQSRYELRAAEPTELTASPDTVEFLKKARSRTVEIDGQQQSGLAVGPNRAGDKLLLAASPRVKPGAHRLKISAVSESGETADIALDVVVQALAPVPNNATRPPVVLLNGWETGFTGTCPISTGSADTFGNLAQYLISDGVPVVYLFDNCAEDANQSVETLGNDLGTFLNAIKYANGTQVPQIDLVAFSMGGLIARAYLAGLQPQGGEVLMPPATTLVRDMVMIATPNFGSFVAAIYATALSAGTQSAELIPASSLLWNLGTWNQYGDDLRGVNAIAVVGNAGSYNQTVANASDGLVTMTSASLGFVAQQSSVTRVVPYCHIDPILFTNVSFGSFACNAPGIANVTDTSQLTGQIVRSFLSGADTWTTIGTSPTKDPYLSVDGGAYFALMSTNGGYVTDLTGVTWGSVTMSLGADAGTIFWDDMVFGSSSYVAASATLGTVTCASSKEAVGYIAVTRCKMNATITGVSPEANAPGRVVAAGASLTINGASLGSQCGSCKVTATPAGSTIGSSASQSLKITSWNSSAVTVTLPSTTGFMILTVTTANGTDNITVMVVPSAATVAVAPASLQFTYMAGGPLPDAQSVAITNGGSGSLNWTASAADSWVVITPASGTAPSTLSITVSPQSLSAGSYQSTIQVSGGSGAAMSIAVTLTVQAAASGVSIGGITNAASFQPGFASATWISIFGSNLSAVTDSWNAGEFVNGALPTALDGVSVTINGIAAYPAYVSPTQLNVLAPDDATLGPVTVQVTAGGQQSPGFTAQKAQFAPALFTSDGTHVTAQPVAPGQIIELYGTGFGPVTPPLPTSQLVTTPSILANNATVMIGGVAATVQFAGLVEPGLYQLNVTVPALPNGDAAVTASVGGVQTQTGLLITIQQ
jgi:uncharacterized protein (TIGR03437 family)